MCYCTFTSLCTSAYLIHQTCASLCHQITSVIKNYASINDYIFMLFFICSIQEVIQLLMLGNSEMFKAQDEKKTKTKPNYYSYHMVLNTKCHHSGNFVYLLTQIQMLTIVLKVADISRSFFVSFQHSLFSLGRGLH